MSSSPYPIDRKITEMASTTTVSGGDFMEVSKQIAPYTYSSRKIGQRDLLHALSGDISSLPATSAIYDNDILHVAIQEVADGAFIPYNIEASKIFNYVNYKLTPTISSLSAGIISGQIQINELSADVNVLQSDVSSLSAQVNINTNGVILNNNNIISLSSDVNSLDLRVTAQEIVIDSIESLSGLSGDCCLVQAVQIGELSAQQATNTYNIDVNTYDITANYTDIVAISGEVENINYDINDISGQVLSNDVDIDFLSGAIDDINTGIVGSNTNSYMMLVGTIDDAGLSRDANSFVTAATQTANNGVTNGSFAWDNINNTFYIGTWTGPMTALASFASPNAKITTIDMEGCISEGGGSGNKINSGKVVINWENNTLMFNMQHWRGSTSTSTSIWLRSTSLLAGTNVYTGTKMGNPNTHVSRPCIQIDRENKRITGLPYVEQTDVNQDIQMAYTIRQEF